MLFQGSALVTILILINHIVVRHWYKGALFLLDYKIEQSLIVRVFISYFIYRCHRPVIEAGFVTYRYQTRPPIIILLYATYNILMGHTRIVTFQPPAIQTLGSKNRINPTLLLFKHNKQSYLVTSNHLLLFDCWLA